MTSGRRCKNNASGANDSLLSYGTC